MNSLRSLASITAITLALTLSAPPGFTSVIEKESKSARDNGSAAEAKEPSTKDGLRNSDTKGKEDNSEGEQSQAENQDSGEKGNKKFRWFKHSKDNDNNGEQKSDEKSKEEPLSATEAAALEAAAERAKQLKTYHTPFNVQANSAAADSEQASTLSTTNSLRSRLAQRLGASSRVYLPGRMTIGRPAEFVIKGKPGSHAAVAMADKDSGARALFGQKLRLGADRKLMAAGVIPESGVLTLIVDMPIQGDLIGLPVFFETVVWQKEDFSDMEIAVPVKSESAQEIADKANAVIVSGEKEQKRGLRFTPGSGVPLYQQQNGNLESGGI